MDDYILPKTAIERSSIPTKELVVGDLYAVLLIGGNNTWFYGIYNGDSLSITDTEKIMLEFCARKLCYARTGPGRWDTTLASFHPITVDVESMVSTWKAEEAARGNWGWGGPAADVPLRRVGWDLATHLRERAWARRKHAVAAWALARAAIAAEETAGA